MSQHATTELEALLTPGEVIARLKISRATFYRYIASGELEHVRLGGREGANIRVPVASLRRFLASTRPADGDGEPTHAVSTRPPGSRASGGLVAPTPTKEDT